MAAFETHKKEAIMAKGRLEHVNISVSDVDRTARFLEALTGWPGAGKARR